jgi:hypothetical protein
VWGGVIQTTVVITGTLAIYRNLDVLRQCPLMSVKVGWRVGEALETEEGKEMGSKLVQIA